MHMGTVNTSTVRRYLHMNIKFLFFSTRLAGGCFRSSFNIKMAESLNTFFHFISLFYIDSKFKSNLELIFLNNAI